MTQHNGIYARVQPQATDLERVLIGAIMLEKDRLEEVIEIIPNEDIFYSDRHRIVYKNILELWRNGEQMDMAILANKLMDNGDMDLVGGAYEYTKLTDGVVNSAHCVSYAYTVLDKWKKREAIKVLGNRLEDFYDDTDTTEAIAVTCSELDKISDYSTINTTVHISLPAKQTVDRIEFLMGKEAALTGVDTGLKELNRITSGWQDTDLIILAARPAQGKTALALNFALNACISQIKPCGGVLIFSLEMSALQLNQRVLSAVSKVHLGKIRNGQVNRYDIEHISRASAYISKLPIYIDDKAAQTISTIYSKAKRYKRKKGIGMVIVDYLQLARVRESKGMQREQVISEISQELKRIAKDLEVPVIALSQMNRGYEQRKGKPELRDLRESGAIEQDADMVIFIYHEFDGASNIPKNMLSIAKHRNGAVDDIEVKFLGEIQKWVDADSDTGGFKSFTQMKQIMNNDEDEPPF